MKFIDEFMEKKAQDALRKENEQIERKDRLSELESKHQKKRNTLLHPVKTANERKEIKNLKKEIDAYEKNKEDKKSILILGGLSIGLLALLALLGVFHKTPENPLPDEITTAQTSAEATNENSPKEVSIAETIVNSDEQSDAANSKKDTIVSDAKVDDESEKTIHQETIGQKDDPAAPDSLTAQGIMSSDLRVRVASDYVHASSNLDYIGNDEGITVTIEVNKGIEIEDIVFDYDTSLLNIDIEELDHQDGMTKITAYVTADEECNTELFITTKHEVETLTEDEVMGYSISINKLDSSEGRIVFITPMGTKYHYDAGCAGENAMKTTYHDAIMLEYEPCGTCAN